jgi:hypothetical protein
MSSAALANHPGIWISVHGTCRGARRVFATGFRTFLYRGDLHIQVKRGIQMPRSITSSEKA